MKYPLCKLSRSKMVVVVDGRLKNALNASVHRVQKSYSHDIDGVEKFSLSFFRRANLRHVSFA
jgi:hypothetical protein